MQMVMITGSPLVSGVFLCACMRTCAKCRSDMSTHDSVSRMCVCFSKDTSSRNSHFQNIWPDILPGNWFIHVNLYMQPHALIHLHGSDVSEQHSIVCSGSCFTNTINLKHVQLSIKQLGFKSFSLSICNGLYITGNAR